MTSTKNINLSSAGIDLGLGDQLQQQVEDAEAERKKKLMGTGKQGLPNLFGDNALAPAAMMLFGKGNLGG
jgi:hypothetical protein